MLTIEQARCWYPQEEAVHGFDHILRVYRLAERLAQLEGADWEIVRAAALLHDARGGAQGEHEAGRGGHHLASAAFAGQVLEAEGWPAERIVAVQHCIRAHRFRDETERPETLEARVLFDADKLDAIGAVGAARAIAYAAQAGQPFYGRVSDTFIERGERQPGEPHSAYHEFIFKLCAIKERMQTASGRQMAEARHRFMETFFERLGEEIEGGV